MNRALLAAGACAVLALTGCSASLTSTTVKTTGVTSVGSASTPQAKAASAHVGTTITLDDSSTTPDAQHVAITLMKVKARAVSANQYATPDAGKRFYAVQLRITNRARIAFSDTPSNGMKVIDSAGQQYEAEIGDEVTSGQPFPSGLTLTPGSSGLGWVTFQVPSGAVVTGMQYALDSGFGPVGQWSIP